MELFLNKQDFLSTSPHSLTQSVFQFLKRQDCERYLNSHISYLFAALESYLNRYENAIKEQ